MMKQLIRNTSSWLWIPTLYFAEGIPYFIVNNISVTMFTRMGVPNGEMALFTSLLYLPWTIKPLWSPFVDILRTKRWWILAMQVLISIIFILLTLSIPHPSAHLIGSIQTPVSFFTFTLILFFITAFASATHDIAADGFYMLALNHQQQSFFVGIRSTFYRLSSIFGQGVLVLIAGLLETHTGSIPLAWTLTRFLYTSTGGGFCATWCNKCTRPGYYLGVRAHLCNLFSEAWCGYCGCLYVALSTARSLSLENG